MTWFLSFLPYLPFVLSAFAIFISIIVQIFRDNKLNKNYLELLQVMKLPYLPEKVDGTVFSEEKPILKYNSRTKTLVDTGEVENIQKKIESFLDDTFFKIVQKYNVDPDLLASRVSSSEPSLVRGRFVASDVLDDINELQDILEDYRNEYNIGNNVSDTDLIANLFALKKEAEDIEAVKNVKSDTIDNDNVINKNMEVKEVDTSETSKS